MGLRQFILIFLPAKKAVLLVQQRLSRKELVSARDTAQSQDARGVGEEDCLELGELHQVDALFLTPLRRVYIWEAFQLCTDAVCT